MLNTQSWKLQKLSVAFAATAFFAVAIPGSVFAQTPTVASSPAAGEPADDLSPQEYADMGEAALIVRDLRALRPKTVVLIFDVSGSMKGAKMLRRAREAAVNVVRYGTFPGDTVRLFTFGATSEETNREIQDGEDKRAILDKIPSDVGADAGTNIRRPHFEALKRIAAEAPRPAAIVVLTDSFNDEPKRDTNAFGDYTKFYTPGGQLTKYPNSPENRDYERLLRELVQSGKVKQYGVGIQFAGSGRPIERLPQAAPPPVEVEATPAPVVPTTPPAPTKGSVPIWVWLAVGAAVVAAALWALRGRSRPIGVRVTGVGTGHKDYSVGSGQTLRLGGPSGFAPDVYPLPGVGETGAVVRVSGGRLMIGPPTPARTPAKAGAGDTKTALSPGQTSNPAPGLRVYHNGLLLENEVPLQFGDEVRVSVPSTGGAALGKEYRIKFADPTQLGSQRNRL